MFGTAGNSSCNAAPYNVADKTLNTHNVIYSSIPMSVVGGNRPTDLNTGQRSSELLLVQKTITWRRNTLVKFQYILNVRV